MVKPKYKIGDYIIVHPYCDPEGLIGRISGITHKMDQGHVYHIKYVEGPDKFGRDTIITEVEDGNVTFVYLGKELKDSDKILFGRPV